MIRKVIAFFQLSYLCFQLALNILAFGAEVFLVRVKKNRINKFLLLFLFFLIWLGNLYIYHKKNTPQIEIIAHSSIESPLNIDLPTNQFLLTKIEVANLLMTYTEIEKNQVKNLGLYLNLSQLENVIGNKELAQKHLQQAKNITP